MVNKEFTKDITKSLKKTSINTELPAGVTPRRYDPVEGVNNLNKRIHRESKWVDDNKKLPFSFSKPTKSAKGCYKKCISCGDIKHVNINTVGIECKKCHQYSSLEEIND